MDDEFFPTIKKGIDKLIEDEEGNIPGNKLLMLGTMIVVLGSLMSMNIFADHRSHSSHTSHSSHSSGSSGSHGSHVSHQSHESHASVSEHSSHDNTHSSHASHTSHSNSASHSNSLYSSEGDVTYGPAPSTLKGISAPVATPPENSFHLPNVNENIQNPNGTPTSSIIPAIGVPDSTTIGNTKHANPLTPPETGKIE